MTDRPQSPAAKATSIQTASEASTTVLRLVEHVQQFLDAVNDVLRGNHNLRNSVISLQQEREQLQAQCSALSRNHQHEPNERVRMEQEHSALLAELSELVAQTKERSTPQRDSAADSSSPSGPELLADLRALLGGVEPSVRSLDLAGRLRGLSELSGALAHDLNNTLTGILVRVQMLMGSVSDGSVRRQLRMIEHVASDGAWMVKRLQDFSRSRSTRPFDSVDLNHLVEEIALLAQSSLGHPGSTRHEANAPSPQVRIETTSTPSILGDVVELRDAVTSIVLSAIDAMPAGGRLTLRTGTHREQVFCTIAHTGLPLSEDEQLRIFDPVFGVRREKATVRDLSGAYAAARRHGGDIEVSSDGQRGTEFKLLLPITAPVTEPPAEPEPQLPAGSDSPHGGRPRILVIDDSIEVRDVLRDLLAQHGYIVVATENGESGLAEAEQRSFALAMVDLGLPGLSGLEAATRIKHQWPDTFVILMTGYTDRIGIHEARDKGIDAVLTKPFSLDQVKALIAQALAQATAGTRDASNDLVVPDSP